MPYNPGINDISGQLRAQGKRDLATGIGGGVTGGIQEFMQNKLRNQVLQGDNEVLWKAFSSDPETAKYAPPEIEKFIKKSQEGGGLSLNDNIKFNGMLNAGLKTRALIEERKMAEQKRQLMEIEAKDRALQVQAAQREQEAVAKLQRLAQAQQGVGSGVLRADVQDRNKKQLDDPLMQFAAQVVQATGRAPSPADLREFAQQQGMGGATPAQRDTSAIINSELAAGKLKLEQVEGRRAELLAKGGRDPEDRYDMVGTYVKRKTGGDPITVFKERATSRVGMVGKDGKFTVVDTEEYMPSTTSNANPYMDPEPFSKFAADTIQKEGSVKSLVRFMEGAKDLPTGINKLSTRIAAAAKTVLGQDLTEEEKKLGVARARQQRLLGALRTTILGPGVLTEIDAQRILSAVGGDVDALTTNPEVMNQVLGEILQEKMQDYESALDVYNANVSGRHGSAGYKQRKKVEVALPAQEQKLSEPAGALQIKSIKRIE